MRKGMSNRVIIHKNGSVSMNLHHPDMRQAILKQVQEAEKVAKFVRKNQKLGETRIYHS